MHPSRFSQTLLAVLLVVGCQGAAEVDTMTREEVNQLTDELRPVVEELRGLKFKKRVPVEVVDDARAGAYFESQLSSFVTPEDDKAAALLGLLPPGVGLAAAYLDVLEEQAGGYYDPDRDTLCLLGDMQRGMAPILLVHELTHALDDQHYDIDAMLEAVEEHDDRLVAVGCVVEGSGTLVMAKYLVREMQAGRLDREVLAAFQRSEAGRAEKLAAAPQLVRRSLLSSYVLGQSFLLRGNLAGMVADLNIEDFERAFTHPPVSSEQILYAEKYWDDDALDEPRFLQLPDLSATLGPGWALSGDGECGELVMAMLTGADDLDVESAELGTPSNWTNDAAAGWDGDQWQLYSNGESYLTALASVWDTETDAREFAAAVQSVPERWVQQRGDAVLVVVADAGTNVMSDAGEPPADFVDGVFRAVSQPLSVER